MDLGQKTEARSHKDSVQTQQRKRRLGGVVQATALAFLLQTGPVLADAKNILFILDASNSMWAPIDGTPKIRIAKEFLTDLVTSMPNKTNMGLVAYGHRFDRKLKACDDMELINPVGHLNAGAVANSLSFVSPKGQTPIAAVLSESRNWLEGQRGQPTTVVLISDGVESCDGNPCAAAKELNDAGISTKIHVVGFGLSEQQSQQIVCIAANGNGRYFDAKNASELKQSLEEVRAGIVEPITVAEAKPEPVATPESVVVFSDEFDWQGLTEGWNVINPNEDQYIAEAGELLMIASPPAGLINQENLPNIVTHPTALPQGDWQISVKFKTEFKHGAEAFYVGVMDDHENWLAAGLRPSMGSGEVQLQNFIAKLEKGKETRFDTAIDARRDTDSRKTTARWTGHGLGDVYGTDDFEIVLRKEGRSYSMSGTYSIEGQDNYRTFESQSLRMLRGKKKLFIAFGLF